jgi:hypothetical protein
MEYRWELHFGSLSIEVYPSGGLTVDILDTKTGEQTQVIIPLTICIVTITALLIISGCGAYYNQPTGIEKAVIGESTSNNIIKGFA